MQDLVVDLVDSLVLKDFRKMQILIFAFIIVIVVGGRASDASTDEPTDAPTEGTTVAPFTTTLAPTTSKPFNDCPEGWVYAGPLGCFYFNTNKHKSDLSWIEAQGECEILGGFLAEVKTEGEHEFLKGVTGLLEEFIGRLRWWIGLTDMGHESDWIWEHSKQSMTFESWISNRPNIKDHNLDDCTLMDCENHSCDWMDLSCTDDIGRERHPISFICQKSHTDAITTPIPASTTPIFPGCDSGWNEYERACYKFSTSSRNWGQARDACLNEGSYLASVLSDGEQQFIRSITNGDYNNDVWIGLKMATFDFEWEDGNELSYTHWHSGEPNYGGDCVVMGYYNYNSEWLDTTCSNTNFHICKKTY